MKVLLSIKPQFADLIFSGIKKYEFRKSVYRNPTVRTVVVYATKPVGRIIGEFDVAEVVCADPDTLWERTHAHSGISREFFDAYFLGREKSFALAVGEVRKYERSILPEELIDNFTPPQSFMYVDDTLVRMPKPQQELPFL